MRALFVMGLFLLVYVYALYPLILLLAACLRRKRGGGAPEQGEERSISVIIAARNEEASIAKRMIDLARQEYPMDRLEIVLVSDGSTDGTVAAAYASGVDARILDLHPNGGRALAHNAGVAASRGDILVFTDAETLFERDFLRRVDARFADSSVGCVVGNLIYRTDGQAVSESEGFYWSLEKSIRLSESALGLLATGTGACMAVRRDCWEDLAATEDVDFITPLDVAASGLRCVFAPEAVAYDTPASTPEREFRTRVRQVSRNLTGTLRHWFPDNAQRHPILTWAILSHKVLRWLSPFSLGLVLLANIALLGEGAFWSLFFLAQLVCYAAALYGHFGGERAASQRLVQLCYGFCIANAGMAVGVVKGLLGLAPAVYENR